ncbi:hypothetical protein WMY93_004218 [Mugilogobius chulae]|uniref:C-type lectin domain-containing protein n=1 Tax=Mugilogobius chulae TaxID=88201 RepID=A0AAW0PN52_9GOBI
MAALRLLMLFCLTSPAVLTAPAKAAEGNQGCAEGWTKFGSRCFKLINEKITWFDAEKSCHSLGANLASIHSAEENSFITDLIKTATGSNSETWIGGADAVKEGQWLWSDGSVWDFTNWHSGQPDNAGNNEHCIEIHVYYFMNLLTLFPLTEPKLWNDRHCTYTNVYMCAKDAQKEAGPVSLLTVQGCNCQFSSHKGQDLLTGDKTLLTGDKTSSQGIRPSSQGKKDKTLLQIRPSSKRIRPSSQGDKTLLTGDKTLLTGDKTLLHREDKTLLTGGQDPPHRGSRPPSPSSQGIRPSSQRPPKTLLTGDKTPPPPQGGQKTLLNTHQPANYCSGGFQGPNEKRPPTRRDRHRRTHQAAAYLIDLRPKSVLKRRLA